MNNHAKSTTSPHPLLGKHTNTAAPKLSQTGGPLQAHSLVRAASVAGPGGSAGLLNDLMSKQGGLQSLFKTPTGTRNGEG